MTKMPPRVTASDASRKVQPSSPPMVPASSVRIRLSHIASTSPTGSPPLGLTRSTDITSPMAKMTRTEATPSPSSSATVPRAM